MTVMESVWAVPKAIFQSWGSALVGRHDKLFAYGLLLGLGTMSLVDCIMDWSNYEELADPDYRYGLATGPPKEFPLRCLLWFNVVGSVLFVMEIINTLTLMCNGGHTKMPIEVEQTIVIVLEEIPQAAANLAIVICRNDALMSQQTITCIMALLNSATRLYFYGWAKEKWFKNERTSNKMTLKIGIYTSATMLWSFLLFTQIFMWHHARLGNEMLFNTTAKYYLLSGVSIFLLNAGAHEFPNTKVYNFSIDLMIHDQGLEVEKPWLVDDIIDIVADIDIHHHYDYPCKRLELHTGEAMGDVIKPASCKGVDFLKFVFKHEHNHWIIQRHPLGEIRYNFARVSKNGTRETCVAATEQLEYGWDLYYLLADIDLGPSNKTEKVFVTSPWPKACITPSINYDPHLKVC